MGSGVVHDKPWPHLEFNEFLDQHYAEHVSTHWPVDGWQWLKHSDAVRPDGTSLRRYQNLRDAFPGLWCELLSPRGTNYLREKLGVDDGLLYPQALLVEDAPGYWIRKHTDCAGKVISAQCYFPDDGAPETQGVVLEPDWQIPYRFNYGYAFKVSGHSWHRVRPSPMRRRSLQLIYYDTPTPRI